MSAVQRIRSFLRFAVASSKRAAALDADVVFATSTPLTIALPGASAAFRRSLPMVFEVRDLWPEIPIAMGFLSNPLAIHAARRLERFAYRRSAHIVALSEGMADGVRCVNGDRVPISVITNSCDIETFRSVPVDRAWLAAEYGVPESATLLLYSGTLGAANNVGYLVDMMDRLRKDLANVVLLVVGDGAEKTKCIEHATRLGLEGSVIRFIPPTEKAAIAKLMACATISMSVFANIPELFHNSANKFFDGLAAGDRWPSITADGSKKLWSERVRASRYRPTIRMPVQRF